jgi:hypothetical protein
MKNFAAALIAAVLLHSSQAVQVKPGNGYVSREIPGAYVVELSNGGLKARDASVC